jgi:hypothetical protein
MARRVPGVMGAAHKVPTLPPGRIGRSGPMATGKTQAQSGEGKSGNPKNAASVNRVRGS